MIDIALGLIFVAVMAMWVIVVVHHLTDFHVHEYRPGEADGEQGAKE